VVGVSTLERGSIHGHLEVGPEVLVCRMGRSWDLSTSGPDFIRHKGTVVDVYHARMPFWCNVGVLVNDGQRTIVAAMWAFGRRAIISTLEGNGFRIQEHRTMLEIGRSHMGRP
jgi:hypothetical protein